MTTAYLDHAASTPMRPEAVAAMAPLFDDVFGNPSGQHAWARRARRRLDDARDQVAAAVGAQPGEVVFTSGGTEADNLAVAGVVAALGGRPLCSTVEHHAVLDPVRALGGIAAPVDGDGRVRLGELADLLRRAAAEGPPVTLVSVLLANNEVGTVLDLGAVAEVVRRHAPDAVLHTDAVAAAPWLDLVEAAAPAQLVTLSGHKLGGPKGSGVLVVRDGTPLEPILRGGGQERERRSGTPDVAGAVGLAAALGAAVAEQRAVGARVADLRDRLVAGLLEALPQARETVPASAGPRLPSIAHLCLHGVASEPLLFLLDQAGLAASAGSSCASGALEPSHVVGAMGVAPAWLDGTLRLSLGRTTTDADVDHALAVVPGAVAQLRGGSPADLPAEVLR